MTLLHEPAIAVDLHSRQFFSRPEETLARLRDEDPVYYDQKLHAWVLTRYDDVSAALRSPLQSVDRNGEIGRSGSPLLAKQLEAVNSAVQKWMVFSDPPRHTRLRSAVFKAFQPKALRSLQPFIEETAEGLVDRADNADTFDILSDLGEPLAETVTAHMLGLPIEDAPRLKKWTADLFSFLGAALADDDIVRENARGVEAFRDYVSKILSARRDSPQDDLISSILQDVAGEFSEEEVIGLVHTLVAGSYETTSHSITNGIYCLLKHPEELEALREKPESIETAVEEILRFAGPAFAVQRRALQDVQIRGRLIREKERIYCILHGANHDPEAFEAPGSFKIDRFPCRHLGLGLGGHFCLGAWLTRLETQKAIGKLVQRYPHLRQAEDKEPEWKANFAIRGLSEFVVSTRKSTRDPQIFMQAHETC